MRDAWRMMKLKADLSVLSNQRYPRPYSELLQQSNFCISSAESERQEKM